MSASRLERSRMPSPHDCKRSPTLIVCVAVASAAAGVVFSVILPLLGHLVPVLQYTLPEHRKTTLGRYRLVVRDSRKHQRHKSGKSESSQCSDPPPSPNSDTTSSTESHPSPAKCRAPLRRAKTVIRVRCGQPEWIANVNEWRRRSTAYSASIVESCQTRIGRMNLTRRSATQMTISTLSPRSSISDPSFGPPLSSSSTVTFRDPFQPASLGSSAKSFKECTVPPLSTQHPLDPARTYQDMALEQTSDYYPQPVRKGNVALNGVVPWWRRKSKDLGSESIEAAGYGRRLSLRKLYKVKTPESS